MAAESEPGLGKETRLKEAQSNGKSLPANIVTFASGQQTANLGLLFAVLIAVARKGFVRRSCSPASPAFVDLFGAFGSKSKSNLDNHPTTLFDNANFRSAPSLSITAYDPSMKVKEALYNVLFGPDRSVASTSTHPTPSLHQAAASLKIPPESLSGLSSHSIHALQNLSRYKPRPGSEPCPGAVPAYRRAAVLLGLFAGRNGELYVILSKRSSRLRSHGGDTAIPGGRFEPTDRDLEFTARREAFEETGLPIDSTKAVKLCELPPYLSANELVVTPFVVFLTDHTIQPHLNPREVDSLFSLPLISFLYHNPPRPLRKSLHLPPTPDPEALRHMPANEVSPISDWHTCRDILWLGNHRIRRHTFWDERNPIRGLTSDILILAAMVAFGEKPQFSVTSPNQLKQEELIKLAFDSPLAVKKFRVRPRMQFLKTPDAFSFNRTERTNDELEQPQDERSDFVLAPPIGKGEAGVVKPKL